MTRGCEICRQINVLPSSCGRRVALMGCFREALRSPELDGRVVGVDCSRASAAFNLADAAWQVLRCTDAKSIPAMIELCQRERIGLIVPTIDPELPVRPEVIAVRWYRNVPRQVRVSCHR